MPIQFTPNELQAKAQKIRSIKDNINHIIQNAEKEVNNLRAVWEGDSQIAFFNTYNQIKARNNSYLSRIDTIATRIINAAEMSIDADTRLSNSIRR